MNLCDGRAIVGFVCIRPSLDTKLAFHFSGFISNIPTTSVNPASPLLEAVRLRNLSRERKT